MGITAKCFFNTIGAYKGVIGLIFMTFPSIVDNAPTLV